jgi:hypothetical protein
MTSSKPRSIDIFTIDWQGTTLSVTYEEAYLGLTWNAHLQIEALTPSRAPLPMTETGYRSYFCHPEEIAVSGGPVAYVLAWLEQDAQSKEWQKHAMAACQQQEADKQLSLF